MTDLLLVFSCEICFSNAVGLGWSALSIPADGEYVSDKSESVFSSDSNNENSSSLESDDK